MRGGELALLLGATFPGVRAVVAYVPSHVVHPGVAAGDGAWEPAWSFGGAPLPFVPPLQRSTGMVEPIALTPLFLAAMEDTAAVERAAIPVERINGPVLLISGRDDQMWPSAMMADRVMGRLRAHQHPHPDTHLAYERAGHTIGLPLYAAAGIAEVWIVDLDGEQVLEYRLPAAGKYTQRSTVRRGGVLVPGAFPDLTLPVDDLLGPRD